MVMTRDDGLRHADCLGEECCATVRGSSSALPGGFAISDGRSGSIKRVTSAVGMGASLVAVIHEYQASLRREPDAADG
jgi:thioredoxin reductase